MTAADIARACQAFQGVVPSDIEYGVSDEDAACGVLAALQELGFASDIETEAICAEWSRQKKEARAQREAQEAARRAALTPQQRRIEDEAAAAREALLAEVAGSMFASSPLLRTFRKGRHAP